VAQANVLAHEVLGRSLDEVPPQTRRLLTEIVKLVNTRAAAEDVKREAVRFTRRELRAALAWGDTQLKTHLARLVELEFVLAHREGQGFVYELAYDGDGSAAPHLSGLIDIERLCDAKRSGVNGDRSGLGRPAVGGRSGTGRDDESAENSIPASGYDDSRDSAAKTHISKGNGADSSYPQSLPLAAAPRA
jgi:DNA primase